MSITDRAAATADALLPTAPAATARDAWGLALGALFGAVFLSPVRHYFNGPLSGPDAPKLTEDSFPLSTFPMFSEDRKKASRVPHVIGLTASGERILPHHKHFGPGGLNQVRKTIARTIRRGGAVEIAQAYADSLAAQQAKNGGRRAKGSGPNAERRAREQRIVTVEVVRSRFVFDDYYGGRRLPEHETVHARAAVGGTAEAVEETRTAQQIEEMAR